VNSLDAEALADNFLGSRHCRFSCPSVVEIKIPYVTYPISFRLYNPPFLAVNAQTGRFIVEQATLSEGANFASCTCSNARFQIYNQLVFGNGYLEAEFDTVDLIIQELVGADVLRECSQWRDAELRAAD
jgi:hypothetical protein